MKKNDKIVPKIIAKHHILKTASAKVYQQNNVVKSLNSTAPKIPMTQKMMNQNAKKHHLARSASVLDSQINNAVNNTKSTVPILPQMIIAKHHILMIANVKARQLNNAVKSSNLTVHQILMIQETMAMTKNVHHPIDQNAFVLD